MLSAQKISTIALLKSTRGQDAATWKSDEDNLKWEEKAGWTAWSAARERSKPMSRQSYRNDRSIEASSRGAGDGDSGGEKEVESGAEEDQWGRSPDLHFDKKSREKFSPISVVPYLILYRSLVSEGEETSSRPFCCRPLPSLFLLFVFHIPVLFLPHYAGLAYLRRRRTQLPRREVVFPWKMSIKVTRRGGGKRGTRNLGGIAFRRAGSNLNFFPPSKEIAHDPVRKVFPTFRVCTRNRTIRRTGYEYRTISRVYHYKHFSFSS